MVRNSGNDNDSYTQAAALMQGVDWVKVATEYTRKLYVEHLKDVTGSLKNAESTAKSGQKNIDEVAAQELHFLKKCFPDFLKNANIDKLEASLSPAEVIKALDSNKPQLPERQ